MLALVLSACGPQQRSSASNDAGAGLEAAASAAGLIADPGGSLVGAWARDSDRVCIVPRADGTTRIGVVVDYGDGQACAASGIVQRSGDKLRVQLEDCRFEARFDGERLIFPAELPIACERLCRGRASLAALAVERQGASSSEAATLRGPGGRALCGS
ncbi:hypothetical protein [Sphingomonas sp.]|uniref:hypothetical protein n=1 Tax=Sphingomonas sp. TaxID=28214 RepID=UPI002ED93D35